MAGLAVIRCSHMIDRFAGGDATVMAGHAGTSDLFMVNIGNRLPAGGGMTTLAGGAGKYMCQVLAGGDATVMAGNTGTDHLRVIHLAGGLEGRCHMTTFTGITAKNVCSVLTGRCRTVVTGRTASGNTGVVITGRLPGQGAMASLASTGRGYMTE